MRAQPDRHSPRRAESESVPGRAGADMHGRRPEFGACVETRSSTARRDESGHLRDEYHASSLAKLIEPGIDAATWPPEPFNERPPLVVTQSRAKPDEIERRTRGDRALHSIAQIGK